MGFIINPYQVIPSTPAFSFLLDTYSGAATAYSFRKLRSAYSGNCIRVRRSSDNTEQDIGFVSNVLDTTSLLSFVGANNGFVTTWYDQSGNAVNITNSTAATQPQIVSSGALVTVGGGFTGMSSYGKLLSNTQTNASTQATFIGWQQETTGNDSLWALPLMTIGSTTSSTYAGILQSGSGTSANSNFGSPSYYKNNSLLGSTRGDLYTAFVTGSKSIANVIGGGTTTSNRFLQYGSGYSGNYKVFEVITYNSDQSANRTGINTNINTYYSVY